MSHDYMLRPNPYTTVLPCAGCGVPLGYSARTCARLATDPESGETYVDAFFCTPRCLLRHSAEEAS